MFVPMIEGKKKSPTVLAPYICICTQTNPKVGMGMVINNLLIIIIVILWFWEIIIVRNLRISRLYVWEWKSDVLKIVLEILWDLVWNAIRI